MHTQALPIWRCPCSKPRFLDLVALTVHWAHWSASAALMNLFVSVCQRHFAANNWIDDRIILSWVEPSRCNVLFQVNVSWRHPLTMKRVMTTHFHLERIYFLMQCTFIATVLPTAHKHLVYFVNSLTLTTLLLFVLSDEAMDDEYIFTTQNIFFLPNYESWSQGGQIKAFEHNIDCAEGLFGRVDSICLGLSRR